MAVQFTVNGDALISNNNGVDVFYRASTQPQSISVWINAAWDGNTTTRSYVGMYGSPNTPGGGLTAVQIGSRGANRCDIWTWGGGILVSTTGITIPANEWINITYTYDGTTHRVYYNGVLNNSANTAQIVGNFDRVWLNGYREGGTNETGTFQVDTYEYFNRELTTNEILTIYNTRGNVHGIVFGSILRYEFDEGVAGATVNTVVNQTNFPLAVSNLSREALRTPVVTFSPGVVSKNLRPPQV